MKLLRIIRGRLSQQENDENTNWSQEFEVNLIESALITTSSDPSHPSYSSNETNQKQRRKCYFIILVTFLSVIRMLLAALSSFMKDSAVHHAMYTYSDTFRCLGSASAPLNTVHAIGCLMTAMYRMIFLWAEPRGLVYQLYSFRDDSIKTVKVMVYAQHILMKLLLSLGLPTLTGVWIASNVKEQSLVYFMVSIPYIVADLYQSYYHICDLINVPLLMFSSTRILSNALFRVSTGIDDARKDANIGVILNSMNHINEISLQVRKHNQLMSLLFGTVVMMMSPLCSLFIAGLTSDISPLFHFLLVMVTLELIILYTVSLNHCGRLYSDSRRLLESLYSLQSFLLYNKLSYKYLLQLQKVIKVVSSNRHPLCFTFPDTTLLTPTTSFSFLLSTCSLTFLFLNNNFLKDLR